MNSAASSPLKKILPFFFLFSLISIFIALIILLLKSAKNNSIIFTFKKNILEELDDINSSISLWLIFEVFYSLFNILYIIILLLFRFHSNFSEEFMINHIKIMFYANLLSLFSYFILFKEMISAAFTTKIFDIIALFIFVIATKITFMVPLALIYCFHF
jgi:hypothetical protein